MLQIKHTCLFLAAVLCNDTYYQTQKTLLLHLSTKVNNTLTANSATFSNFSKFYRLFYFHFYKIIIFSFLSPASTVSPCNCSPLTCHRGQSYTNSIRNPIISILITQFALCWSFIPSIFLNQS